MDCLSDQSKLILCYFSPYNLVIVFFTIVKKYLPIPTLLPTNYCHCHFMYRSVKLFLKKFLDEVMQIVKGDKDHGFGVSVKDLASIPTGKKYNRLALFMNCNYLQNIILWYCKEKDNYIQIQGRNSMNVQNTYIF